MRAIPDWRYYLLFCANFFQKSFQGLSIPRDDTNILCSDPGEPVNFTMSTYSFHATDDVCALNYIEDKRNYTSNMCMPYGPSKRSYFLTCVRPGNITITHYIDDKCENEFFEENFVYEHCQVDGLFGNSMKVWWDYCRPLEILKYFIPHSCRQNEDRDNTQMKSNMWEKE